MKSLYPRESGEFRNNGEMLLGEIDKFCKLFNLRVYLSPEKDFIVIFCPQISINELYFSQTEIKIYIKENNYFEKLKPLYKYLKYIIDTILRLIYEGIIEVNINHDETDMSFVYKKFGLFRNYTFRFYIDRENVLNFNYHKLSFWGFDKKMVNIPLLENIFEKNIEIVSDMYIDSFRWEEQNNCLQNTEIHYIDRKNKRYKPFRFEKKVWKKKEIIPPYECEELYRYTVKDSENRFEFIKENVYEIVGLFKDLKNILWLIYFRYGYSRQDF